MKRPQTPLRGTMTEERLSSLAILHMSTMMVKSHRITNKSHRGYDLVYVAIVKFGNDAKHLRRTSLLHIVHSNLFCNLFNQREPSSEVHKIFTLLSRVKLVRTSSVSTISFSMGRTTATRAKTPFCWLR